MNHPIIITTINPPTTGIRKFHAMRNRHLLIVGDTRTPAYATTDADVFLSVDDQKTLGYRLHDLLPYRHYCRKNLGYLYAIARGAHTIYDTDDDNLPYDDWQFPTFDADTTISSPTRFVNPYSIFAPNHPDPLWPRGLPLDHIRTTQELTPTPTPVPIGVWQGLADGDPDVDAIYRLLYPPGVKFNRHPPFALTMGNYTPFNSQNTLWHRAAFPYLYLPATVSFRFTDILRGYVAQRGLTAMGLHLGFTHATVYQERNDHDLMRDFRDEVECYVGIHEVVRCLHACDLAGHPLDDLLVMYANLAKESLVPDREISIVEAWIEDLRQLARPTCAGEGSTPQ